MIHPYAEGWDRAWCWLPWVLLLPWNAYCLYNIVRSYRAMRRSREQLLRNTGWWDGYMESTNAWTPVWLRWVHERAARGEPPPPLPEHVWRVKERQN